MLESERRALLELEDAIARKKQSGKMQDVIRLMEHGLELRVRIFGPESLHVQKACKDLSDALNGVALKHLQNEEYEEALQVLRKAEVLTGPNDLITAVTYNNLACYYRRRGKLRTALQYLQKALKIESRAKVVVNPAGTRLNLCAVLSQLGKHQQALEQAQASVILLQEELVSQASQQDSALSLDASPELLNKMAVLAISYHNLGVEQEYLKRTDASLISYQKGVEIASYYLGDDNDITKTLMQSLVSANNHIEQQQQKSLQKLAKSRRDASLSGSTLGSNNQTSGVYGIIQEHTRASGRPPSASLRAQSNVGNNNSSNNNNGQHPLQGYSYGAANSSGATANSSNNGMVRRPMSATVKAAREGAGRPVSALPSRISATQQTSKMLPPRPASALPYYNSLPATSTAHQQRQGLPLKMMISPRDLGDMDEEQVALNEDEDGDEEFVMGRRGPRSPPPDDSAKVRPGQQQQQQHASASRNRNTSLGTQLRSVYQGANNNNGDDDDDDDDNDDDDNYRFGSEHERSSSRRPVPDKNRKQKNDEFEFSDGEEVDDDGGDERAGFLPAVNALGAADPPRGSLKYVMGLDK